MKLNKFAAAIALVGTFMGGVATAAPSITNADGVVTPFGGFDWAQASAAWTTGFATAVSNYQFNVLNPGSPQQSTAFNLYYAGWATSLIEPNGQNLESTPNLDTTANGTPRASGVYEYTEFATLTERIVGCNSTGTICTFQVTGGAFDIYYDTNANANRANTTGFTDGTRIIGGTVTGGPSQTFNNDSGGQATLNGTVTYTNGAYIQPQLVNSTLTSTLQLGNAVTGFVVPTAFNGTSFGAGDIVFQADANQTFGAVPEPGMLLLTGAALAACGVVSRRRRQG